MTIDLTEIVIALLGLIATIISTKLIPYLHMKYTSDQLNNVCKTVEIAVNAAEQLAKTGIIKAEERKAYVMKSLESQGIKLDINRLSDIVEAYVNKLPKFIAKEETSESIEFEGDEGIK